MVSHWRQTIKGRRWQSQWRGDCELIERFLFASTESWQKVPAWTLIIGSWSHCPRRTISPPYVGHFSKNKNDKDNFKTISCINPARSLFKRHTDWSTLPLAFNIFHSQQHLWKRFSVLPKFWQTLVPPFAREPPLKGLPRAQGMPLNILWPPPRTPWNRLTGH